MLLFLSFVLFVLPCVIDVVVFVASVQRLCVKPIHNGSVSLLSNGPKIKLFPTLSLVKYIALVKHISQNLTSKINSLKISLLLSM